jgi:hypothetical protein
MASPEPSSDSPGPVRSRSVIVRLDRLTAAYAGVTGVVAFGAGALAGLIFATGLDGVPRTLVMVVVTLAVALVAAARADVAVARIRARRRRGGMNRQ